MPQKLNKSFAINGKVLSANQILTMHWSKRAKYNKAWHNAVVCLAGINETPPGHCIVTFTVYANRVRDYDNITLGLKACLDGIVRAYWLRDDSPDWVTCRYSQIKCDKGLERVYVEIKEQ